MLIEQLLNTQKQGQYLASGTFSVFLQKIEAFQRKPQKDSNKVEEMQG
jgi:hypothetical protein